MSALMASRTLVAPYYYYYFLVYLVCTVVVFPESKLESILITGMNASAPFQTHMIGGSLSSIIDIICTPSVHSSYIQELLV